MAAPPENEPLAAYLVRRLVAQKGFVEGHVPEAAPLAAAVDRLLTLDNGTGFVMIAIVDHDRRDGACARPFALTQAQLVSLGAACSRYAPTYNGARLPVGIQLWHVNAQASASRREALSALHRPTGVARVGVTGWVLDPAAADASQRVWTTARWLQAQHPGKRWLRSVLSSPRVADEDLAAAEGVPAGDASVTRPLLTVGILAALAAVFVGELAARPAASSSYSPDLGTVLSLGALTRDAVLRDHEGWRMLTAALLHGSPVHLLMNGLALYMAGAVLERLVGRAWLAALFVLGALGGSAMGLLLNGPSVVSVGASGAIMGLLAATLVAAMRLPEGAARTNVQGAMARVLVPSLLPLASATGAHVDYAAHFGGAVVGALAGLALWKTWDRTSPLPRGALLAKAVVVAGALMLAWGVSGVAQARTALTALAPQEQVERAAAGEAAMESVDDLVRRYPRDPRARYVRATRRLDAGNATGAEEDLRAALAETRVLQTQFTDRRLEVAVRTLLAQVLMPRGRDAEARSTVAPVCHEGPHGTAPPGLAMLGLCDAS